MLDHSLLKDPEYLQQKAEEFETLKKYLRYTYLGEGTLTEAEIRRLARIHKLKIKMSKSKESLAKLSEEQKENSPAH